MNARYFSFQGKLTDCRLTNTDLIVEVPSAILCKNVFTIPSFKLKNTVLTFTPSKFHDNYHRLTGLQKMIAIFVMVTREINKDC